MTVTDLAASVGTEIAQIETVMREDRRGYDRDEGMQQRYRDLLDARSTGTKAPLLAPEAKEKREIEALMRDRTSAYWKGERAAELQERYRQLIDPESGTAHASDADSWRSTPAQARAALPSAVVRDWDAGDFSASLRRCQDAWAMTYGSIGDPEVGLWFETSFEALPEGVRAEIYKEAARGVPSFAKPADDAEIQNFVSVGAGAAECVKMWGRRAPEMVGRIYDRFARAYGQMPAADQPAFAHWFDGLTPRERLAVLYTLATV
jgi:hypothetical protein